MQEGEEEILLVLAHGVVDDLVDLDEVEVFLLVLVDLDDEVHGKKYYLNIVFFCYIEN